HALRARPGDPAHDRLDYRLPGGRGDLGLQVVHRLSRDPTRRGAVMVTGPQIRAAVASVGGVGGQKWSWDELARGANESLSQAGITTRQGAAVFISQCMVESAYFRTTTEYGSSLRYDPYRGRGFIQRTFKSGYQSFGRFMKALGKVSDANYFA